MSRGPVFHIKIFSASAPSPLPVNHMQAEGRVSGDRKQDKPTTMFSVLRKECRVETLPSRSIYKMHIFTSYQFRKSEAPTLHFSQLEKLCDV